MSKMYKRKFRIYSAWNYQGELETLNRASENGWQLTKPGIFNDKFMFNPDVRYRYQLDFQKVDDMGRYIETFREQGWEYVSSSFNGWHYFRKLYDPSLSDESYEIYPDEESIKEMNHRWAKIALFISLMLTIVCVIYGVNMFLKPKWPTLIMSCMFAFEALFLLRGSIIMFRAKAKRVLKNDGIFMGIFLGVIVLCLIGELVLISHRPHFQTSQRTDACDEDLIQNKWIDLDIPYTDYYYLDLTFSSDEPMTFEVLSDTGEVLYSQTGTDFDKKDIRIRLKKGHYNYALTCPKDTAFNLNCVME